MLFNLISDSLKQRGYKMIPTNLNSDYKKMVLALSLLVGTAACSPVGAKFSSVDDSLNSLSAGGPSTSAVVDEELSGSGSGSIPVTSPATGEVIPSNPITSGIVVTNGDVPFSFEMNSDECVDFNGTDMTFELLKDSKGKVRTAQITSLPTTKDGKMDYGNYTVYALYADENGKLYSPRSSYVEVTVAEERVYGHFNCLFQTSRIEDTSSKIGLPWKEVPQVSQLRIKVDSEENLVGFAIRNQSDDGLVMRCYNKK